MSVLRSYLNRKLAKTPIKWLSATRTKNYLLKDPICDWLKLKKPKGTSFKTNFLCEQGNKFEDLIVKKLYKKYGSHNITNIKTTFETYTSTEKFEQTLFEMKQGTPIILQGAVKNFDDGTAGVPDILIRSDWINRLTSENYLTTQEQEISSVLTTGFHYVVIDIKFSTLPLKSDGTHILNCGRYPSYKGQLCVYNRAVGFMQGYTPSKAYILGRGWKYTKNTITREGKTPFTKLGVIDYEDVDKTVTSEVDDGVEWLRRVEKDGEKWTIADRSTITELYPNMSNTLDDGYRVEKLKIAREIDEITQLYYVGQAEREKCLAQGVTTWKECTSKILGITGKRGRIIDKMIEVNKSDKWILPSNPPKIPDDKVNIYIDFEVINDAFYEVTLSKRKSYIFFIGIGHLDDDGEWVFERKMITDLTDAEEKRICTETRNYILSVVGNKKFRLVHWSGAEPRQWKDVAEKYSIPNFTEWYDLLEYFRGNEIVLNGAFGYGLKEVCRALRKYNKISSNWEDDCKSGLFAMEMFGKLMRSGLTVEELNNHVDVKHISKYNEIDCKVLMEIMKLFM